MKYPLIKNNRISYVSIVLLTILITGLIKCEQPREKHNIVNNSNFREKLISNDERRILFDEYSKTNKQVLMDSRNGEPDSRSYWFSLEDLEGYINFVKQESAGKNLKNLGIRIYLGKYPTNYDVQKMAKPEYAGYQTIFLVPTASRDTASGLRPNVSKQSAADNNMDIESIPGMNFTGMTPPPKVIPDDMN